MPFFILSIISSTAFVFTSSRGVGSSAEKYPTSWRYTKTSTVPDFIFFWDSLFCLGFPAVLLFFRSKGALGTGREGGQRGRTVTLRQEFFCRWSVKKKQSYKIKAETPHCFKDGEGRNSQRDSGRRWWRWRWRRRWGRRRRRRSWSGFLLRFTALLLVQLLLQLFNWK